MSSFFSNTKNELLNRHFLRILPKLTDIFLYFYNLGKPIFKEYLTMAASGITNKSTLIVEPNQTLFCITFKVNRQNYMQKCS